MAEPVNIPADGDVDYTYEILPTHFRKAAGCRPPKFCPACRSMCTTRGLCTPARFAVAAACAAGKAIHRRTLNSPEDKKDAMWTDSDILLVYAPGSTPDNWPRARQNLFPPALTWFFQMHYTTNGRPGKDFTLIGLIFAKEPPEKRVLTLQLTNDHFVIPPGVPDYRVEARGKLPNDALLLSFFPHMHLRGKRFEYNIIHKTNPSSRSSVSIITFTADELPPRRAAATYGWHAAARCRLVRQFQRQSAQSGPRAAVRWGEQTYDEMMVGFFDVAVDSRFDKPRFFQRGVPSGPEK